MSKAYCEKQQTNKKTKPLKYGKKTILEVNKVKPRKKENVEKNFINRKQNVLQNQLKGNKN